MKQNLPRTGDAPLQFEGELLVDLNNAPTPKPDAREAGPRRSPRWYRIQVYRLLNTDLPSLETHAAGIGYRSEFVYRRTGEREAPIDIAFTCREEELVDRLRAHDVAACFSRFAPGEHLERKRQYLIDVTRRRYLALVSEVLGQAGIVQGVASQISALLSNGESARVEFKASARWDLRERRRNDELAKVIVKTLAAFLNTEGGDLLIGVNDLGEVSGLDDDYQTVQKKGRDGYELFLHDLLLNALGKDCTLHYRITFHNLEGKDLCRITAQPSPRPVFIREGSDEHLYIRSGNSTRRLTAKETLAYYKDRWG